MTSPDGFAPPGASTGLTIAGLQEASKENSALAANADVIEFVENIAEWIINGLFQGFENIVDAIEEGVGDLLEDLYKAITGLTGGSLPDISQWFDNLQRLLRGDPIVVDPGDWFSGLLSDLQANFEELLEALQGDYSGSDPILGAIQSVAAGFRQVLTDGGLFNLGQLTSSPINLVTYAGEFDLPETVESGEGWSHDPVEGRTSDGSARFVADGLSGGVLTPPTPARVEPGKKYRASSWIKWSGINPVSGSAASVLIKWYNSSRVEIGESVAASLSSPPAESSDWVKLDGEEVAPAGAYWAAVFIRVEGGVTQGSMWWDDIGLYAEKSTIPQQFVEGLADSLANVIAWVEALVNQLLGSLGISAEGSLFDKILDLGDEIESWFGDTQFLASDFDTLVDKLLSDPAQVIGSIPQSLISGLSTTLDELANNFGGLLASLLGTYSGSNADLLGIQGWANGVSADIDTALNAIDGATSAAVDAVVDGMNNVGMYAAAITAAIRAAINQAISNIFGDGGTKWGQEVLVASGPVTTGPNDIPLGFGMPFSGKITDLSFYSSDHLSTGSGTGVTVEVRKNGTAIRTETWVGGNNSKNVTGLSLSVSKYDRITFWVTSATSQMANMSVSVMGAYV